MKSITILFTLLVGMSCDTVKDLPENTSENLSEVNTTQSSDNEVINQTLEIPGNITFRAVILERFSDKKDICGVSRKNVFQLEIIEILESGSGLTNLPNKSDVLLVSFLFAPQDFEPGIIVEAKARESLCPDASKTFFIVNSHEILE